MAIVLVMMAVSAVALAIVTGRKTEDTLPVIFTGTVVFLYGFYCVDLLLVGRILVYIAYGILVGIAVFFICKKKYQGKITSLIVTPGMVFFVALTAFFFLWLSRMQPSVWDELRLWAASPKALHYATSLQVGEGSLLYGTMQSYPPGMSLFIYFLTALTASYPDAAPFVAMPVLAAVLVLPAFSEMTFRKWRWIIPALVLFLLFPALLTINGNHASGDWAYYYLSLYIDAFLGVVMGSAFFLCLYRPFADIFRTVQFAMLLFFLPALKNTGAMYAAVLVVAAFVIYLLEKKISVGAIIRALICLVSTGVSYGSWQLIIHTRGTGEFIDFHAFSLTAEKIANVLKGITGWGILPFLWIALFFLIADIVITWVLKDIPKKQAVILMLSFLVVCVMFFIGYTSHYGLMLSSIHRYTQTFTFAMFVYLFMRLVRYFSVKEQKEESKQLVKVGTYLAFLGELVVLAAAILVLLGYQKLQYDNPSFAEAEAVVSEWSGQISGYTEKEPAKCYLALGGDIRKQSQKHETIALSAIGTSVNIQNIWCDKLYDESKTGVLTDISEETSEWAVSLSEGQYAYVLVLHPDGEILEAISMVAPDITVSDGMILSVIPAEGKYPVSFQLISD